jgi:predicted  nucleic acid-binding Zn-ribbon protein
LIRLRVKVAVRRQLQEDAQRVAEEVRSEWAGDTQILEDSRWQQLKKASGEIEQKLTKAGQQSGRLPGLESQRRGINLDIRGKQARIRGIEKQIAAIRNEAQVATENDLIAAELGKIVVIRQRAITAMRASVPAGPGLQQKLDPLEAALAEAKIQLARRREALAVAAGGGILQKLTAERIMAAIDTDELEEREIRLWEEIDHLGANLARLRAKYKAADAAVDAAFPWQQITIFHTDEAAATASRPTTQPAAK